MRWHFLAIRDVPVPNRAACRVSSSALQILGRKYGGRDSYGVLRDASYAQDVLRCGPLLGTTFILRAARDLPLREAARWARGGTRGLTWG